MPEQRPRSTGPGPSTPTRRWKRTAAVTMLLLAGGAIVNVAVAWGCVVVRPSSGVSSTVLQARFSAGKEEWFGLTRTFEFDTSSENIYRLSNRSGLPLFAFEAETINDHTEYVPISQSRSGLVLQGTTGTWPRIRFPRVLPLRPIWPGFIINTLFYALLLWLLFFAPLAARRMLRRRRAFRGLCEKCAYPIGASPVCTECGAAVSRHEPRA